MDVASALVRAVRGRSVEVRAQLERLPGVQIHAETADGRFVVTAEDTPQARAADTVVRLQHLEGVLGASLVCQFSDPGAEEA